jgi:hypothetical protein
MKTEKGTSMTSSPSEAVARAVSVLTVNEADGGSWMDMSTRPDAVEEVGRAVARAVADRGAGAVVGWPRPDETVLAHIVARELRVPRAVVNEDLGLLTMSPELAADARVLVVATSLDQYPSLQAVRTLLESGGHHVVGVVTVGAEHGLQFPDQEL